MTRFIHFGMREINLAHVREIYTEGQGKEQQTVIEWTDGSTARTKYHVDTDWLRHDVVPAYPGFFGVSVCNDATPEIGHVFKYPIVAWAIDVSGSEFAATPITADGMPGWGCTDWAVLQPDGKVLVQGDCTLKSLEAWLEYVEQERERRAVVAARFAEKKQSA